MTDYATLRRISEGVRHAVAPSSVRYAPKVNYDVGLSSFSFKTDFLYENATRSNTFS